MTAHETGRISEALTSVEKDLAALWAPAEGEVPKARACTANLVLVAADGKREAAEKLAEDLETAEVARTFVVTLDPHLAPWAVETSVSARCRKNDAGIVCAERIDLALGAATFSRASSIVATLAMSEVPTIVVLTEPSPGKLGTALAHDVARVVLDGEALGLDATCALARSTKAHLVDLSWERIQPWRNLLARFFDDVRVRPAVTAIRRLTVTTTPSPKGDAPLTARLLLGWLSSRLGWRFLTSAGADGAPVISAIDPLHGAVVLDLSSSARAGDAGPGALISVELEATLGDATTHLRLTRESNPSRIHAEHDLEGASAAEDMPIISCSLAVLVDRAILDRAPDAILRSALDAALSYAHATDSREEPARS